MPVLAALTALLLLQQAPQDTRLGLRVEAAFGRTLDVGWGTFRVTVTNDSAAERDLVVRLRPLGGSGGAERREKFAPRTSKRLFMYLNTEEIGQKLHAQIAEASGKVLFEQELERNWDVYSSGSDPTVLAIQDLLPPGCDPSGSWFRCPEADVPDRWIGFNGFKALYLRGTRLEALRPAQLQALVDWIRVGGNAILNPGTNPDWLKSEAAQTLAPVALGEATEVSGPPPGLALPHAAGFGSERYLLHRLRNGEPILSDPKGVSAVVFRQGLGRVVVLGFDLDQKPFSTYPNLHALRSQILASVPSQAPGRGPRVADDWAEIANVSASLVNTLPPTLLLVVLAFSFIVVVGPVNFLVLRRLKAPLLMVVTVPALSVLFLGIVVGAGYLVRGISTVTHDLCLLEASEGASAARQVRMLGVSSPSARTYDLGWPAEEAGAASLEIEHRSRHYRGARDEQDAALVDQTEGWALKGVPFSQWQFRVFYSQGSRDLGGGVSFSVAEGGEVRIENGSTHAFRKGVIVSVSQFGQTRYYPFGPVAAGATARIPAVSRTKSEGCLGAGSVEDRLLETWLRRPGHRFAGEFDFLLAVLDRGPAEVTLDASRSSSSERLAILQVLKP